MLLLICNFLFFYDMYQKSNKIIILKTKQMLNIDLRIKPCSHYFLIFIIPKLFSFVIWDLKRLIKLTDFFNHLLIHVCRCAHMLRFVVLLAFIPVPTYHFKPICIISLDFSAFVTFPIPSADLIKVLLIHCSTSLITGDIKLDPAVTATPLQYFPQLDTSFCFTWLLSQVD